MKKLCLILVLLFSFGLTFAQEQLSTEEQQRREKNVQAANPFVKFGYRAKVATLSKGKYLEVHDMDSIVTIGSVRYHVDKKKIVGFVERSNNFWEYSRPITDTPSRWLSPDPLMEEFPNWDPYNYTMNNPINLTDPTGMAPECDGCKGFILTVVDNVFGSNLRNAYATDSDNYRNGVSVGHGASILASTALIANGAANVGAGGAGLVASAAASSTGVGAVIGAPVAIASGASVATGVLETALGVNIAANAVSNMKSDNIHGNSKSSTKEQHVYEIFEEETGDVVKTGISSGKVSKDGRSYRASSQVNKLNKTEGTGKFNSNIVEKIPAGKGARQKALNAEAANANKLRSQGQLKDQKYHQRP